MRPMETSHSLAEKDLVFYDVNQAPFALYGLCPEEEGFTRVPAQIAADTSPSVAVLAKHMSGVRLRFSTDSPYVALQVKMPSVTHLSHMPLSGTSGLDFYIDTENGSYHRATFVPPYDMKDGYESIAYLPSGRTNNITIHLPLYNEVSALYIGVAEGSSVGEGLSYQPKDPILFYGSSITQGGCASRPGNAYVNMVASILNRDIRCLGFSGSAKAEPAMISYLANCQCSVFVLDYDHNAPDESHLQATHEPLFQAFRAKNPETPVIMLSKPDFDMNPSTNTRRRDIIMQTYVNARKNGDKHVWFIDGERLFDGPFRQSCTVDTCHPNDAGFVCMAKAVITAISQIEKPNW
jgi:hypothetical protein